MAEDLRAVAADFKKPIDEEPVMRRWAAATQRRNRESLHQARGPGGDKLEPNKPYTVKRKGHGRVGVRSGGMAGGLTAGDAAVNYRFGRKDSEAVVHGGPGATDRELNIFVEGTKSTVVEKKATTKRGKVKTWKKRVPAVPGRDFFGVDERDVERAGDDLLTTALRGFGFR